MLQRVGEATLYMIPGILMFLYGAQHYSRAERIYRGRQWWMGKLRLPDEGEKRQRHLLFIRSFGVICMSVGAAGFFLPWLVLLFKGKL